MMREKDLSFMPAIIHAPRRVIQLCRPCGGHIGRASESSLLHPAYSVLGTRVPAGRYEARAQQSICLHGPSRRQWPAVA